MLTSDYDNGNEDLNTSNNSKTLKFACLIIAELLVRSGAIQMNSERKSYAPWFRSFVMKLRELGASYVLLSSLLGISADVLRGFRKSNLVDLTKEPIDDTSTAIMGAWNAASDYSKQTLDHFWSYLGRNYAHIKLSREQMRQTLINLGLKYPRGPKINDHGTTVKRPFAPHTLWEGDGKQMNIFINGSRFSFCWYAFCEQRSTLLVGSTIAQTESSEAFLNALKAGGEKAGFYAIGLLIDNRLSDSDLSPVNEFCQQHNITLVRTFPGNSKSNGNIENNFSIFERFVGDVHIRGNNSAEIARSMAQNIAEIFTQQRNHSPRKRLGCLSPEEQAESRERPEWMRDAVESLARRLNGAARRADEKWQLIASARQHFGDLDGESEQKLKNEIAKYTTMDLIAAQAAYLAQIEKHPDNTYRSEYFLAIVRYKREQIAKFTYNEAFRAGVELMDTIDFEEEFDADVLAAKLVSEIDSLKGQPSQSHQLLRLEAIAWWLVRYGHSHPLLTLWRRVCQLVEATNSITLKQWGLINEYLSRKIGELLYIPPPGGRVSFAEHVESPQA